MILDWIGIIDRLSNRLYTISPKIATLLNNMVVYWIVATKLYKDGRLLIGIPDYVICGFILLILQPFACLDMFKITTFATLSRCFCV